MTTPGNTPQCESAAPDRDSISTFLHTMWGHTTGYVWVPTWNIAADQFDNGPAFSWPDDAEKIIDRVIAADTAGLDVYYSTNVFRTPSRAVGGSVAPTILHADIDRTPTAEDIDRLDSLDAMTVRSGTAGNLHAYVWLDGPVDVATYHRFQDRLAAYLHADAKVRDNDVLRIPGTTNRKGIPSPVWTERVSESVWSVAELNELLPKPAVPEVSAAPTPTITPEVVSQVPPRVKASLDSRSGNRSDDTFAVLKESARSGLPMGQAMSVVLTVPELAERWSTRSASFIDSEIRKAYALVASESAPGADVLAAEDLMGEGVAAETPASAPRSSLRDRMLTREQLRALPSPEPLVKGLLYRDTLAQMHGAPGSYKSFLAMGIACALATRQTTFEDYPIEHAGPVIYVAAEGASGVRARIEAWAQSTIPQDSGAQSLLDTDLLVLPERIDITSEESITEVISAAQVIRPVLIVLDTRAWMTIGSEENSAKDQGEAIANIDRLRRSTGATVLVIHHSSKSGGSARGSGAWDGAVWTNLSVVASDLSVTIRCEKHKEVASGCSHRFTMMPVEVSEVVMPGQSLESRSSLVATSIPAHLITSSGSSDHSNEQEVIRLLLTYDDGRGMTNKMICEAEPTLGLVDSTVRRITNKLVRQGKVTRIGLPGVKAPWFKLTTPPSE